MLLKQSKIAIRAFSALGINNKISFKASYAAEMYQTWKSDPKAVSEQWDHYFRNNQGVSIEQTSSTDAHRERSLVISAFKLIRYYELRGHELATLDPLNLKNYNEFGKIYVRNPLELDIKRNFKSQEIDIPFSFPQDDSINNRIAGCIKSQSVWTLRQLVTTLQNIYCQKIGIQYMHISNEGEKLWMMREFEQISSKQLTKQQKLLIFSNLNNIETFNYFLNDKLKTSKRFGVEGSDTLISGLNALVDEASKHKIENVGFGMAHRGRLNALANVFKKPLQKMFAEFQQHEEENDGTWGNTGDTNYHLGVTNQLNLNGHKIRLSILPNPSHLETVNPVVMGNIRAIQDHVRDLEGQKTLAVLIHGDASLAGQGIVFECLQMQKLKHYSVAGVVHVVVNNQIGFTTTPAEARTGLYCTDVAKSIQSPIIHVNGDQPELVDQAMRLAFKYRQTFKKDIFVDIIGYRRFGHNEQDQPAFTQPMMYQAIQAHPRIYEQYAQRLIQQKVISEAEKKERWENQIKKLNSAYVESLKTNFDIKKFAPKIYHRVVDFSGFGTIKNTGVEPDVLKHLGNQIVEIPSDITLHPQIQKIYEARKVSINAGTNIDMATAEALAFVTLLKDGFNVRLSGQDVERGTFSHRHAVVTCQKTGKKFMPIRNYLAPSEYHHIEIENSFLSEYAVLGYQYGYSLANPNTLTIWEAQFGDFANGAQILLDNYLASGESKWGTQTGLVVNLPHGMDGQGPEHSSGRMERFLQLMSDDVASIVQERKERVKRQIKNSNMQIINCSFAANYFHALRRQLRRDFRKPLINFVSKKLLKFTPAMSSYDLFDSGNRFFTIINESNPQALVAKQNIKKVIMVSGQAYYSLLERRQELKLNDVALVRVEQIAPFPYEYFKTQIAGYKSAKFVWFQQEHRNSGAWTYLQPRIALILEELKKEGLVDSSELVCVSRKSSASPAAGKKKKHDEQHEQILAKVYKI